MVPTVLVCPLQANFPLTAFRVEVNHAGSTFVTVCDLVRPIRPRALVPAGELTERDSRRVMDTFRLLLAG